MKKILSFFLSFSLLFVMSSTAFAAENTANETAVVTSEYSMVQELKEKDANTLLAEGYSISDIERAKSGELERTILNELMERSALSDEILARKGYTANEIAELRSLTGNESLYSVRGLLASVTVKNTKNSYYYKSSVDRTYFLIDVSWSWDKEPAVHWTDIAGAGWDGNYELTIHISYTNNRLSLSCVGIG